MAKRSKLLTIVIPLLLAAVFLFVLVYSSIGLDEVSCQVCVEYGGRTQCRRASATNREDAVRAAVDNACALITSGRDELMACTGPPPSSVACEE